MLTERLQQSENQVLWTTVKKSYKERIVKELRRGRCILKNTVNCYKFVIHNSLIFLNHNSFYNFVGSFYLGKVSFSGFLPCCIKLKKLVYDFDHVRVSKLA